MHLDNLGSAPGQADYRPHTQTANEPNQILRFDDLLPQYSEYLLLGNETWIWK
jgi:hypothetical protein